MLIISGLKHFVVTTSPLHIKIFVLVIKWCIFSAQIYFPFVQVYFPFPAQIFLVSFFERKIVGKILMRFQKLFGGKCTKEGGQPELPYKVTKRSCIPSLRLDFALYVSLAKYSLNMLKHSLMLGVLPSNIIMLL